MAGADGPGHGAGCREDADRLHSGRALCDDARDPIASESKSEQIPQLGRRAQNPRPRPRKTLGRDDIDDVRWGSGAPDQDASPASAKFETVYDPSWGSVRMAGKQAVQEADVVANKNPKTQADQARTKDKAAIQPCEAVSGKRERQG